MNERYLRETPMLNFSDLSISRLIAARGWRSLAEFECVRAVHNFVRDEILFGYNTDDAIPASRVLADGFGQCNTKGTLFMALLRGCGVAVHDFRRPVIDFDRCNTYIQSEGITQDFGIYDSPDAPLREHGQEMSPVKAFTYRTLGRRLMNANVKRLREY